MRITKAKIETWITNKFFKGDITKAHDFLNGFLEGGIEHCGRGFQKTRIELLEICYKETNPQTRWKKAKDLLLDNLETQIPYRRDPRWQLKLEPAKRRNKRQSSVCPRFKAYGIVGSILSIHASFISECVNFVALCNTLCNPKNILPKNVKIYYRKGDRFTINLLLLRHDSMRTYIKLRNGETKMVDVPADIYLKHQVLCSILEYTSGKYNQISNIRQDTFFDKFKETYPEIVKSYRLTPSTKPSNILEVLQNSEQKKFLSEITKESVTNWKWIRESEPLMDREILINIITKKLVEPYNLSADGIVDLEVERYPFWKPNKTLLDVNALSYELADCYLRKFPADERKRALFQLAGGAHYQILNIPAFREIVNSWWEKQDHTNLGALHREIDKWFSHSVVKVKETEKKYWSLYLDVERLVKKGYTKQRAFKELETKYKMKSGTINTRYKERAIEARNLKLTPEDIKLSYGLTEWEEIIPA